jgi:hypothetical protein
MVESAVVVSYASLGVSALSLGVAYLAHRAASPIVQIRAHVEREQLFVEIGNSGRSEVSISFSEVELLEFHYDPEWELPPVRSTYALSIHGPKLPFRLLAHSFEEWRAPVPGLVSQIKKAEAGWVVLYVRVGNEKIRVAVKLHDLELPGRVRTDHRRIYTDIMLRGPLG